ncbi:MAG TPA: acyl-CoA dehydrogenase family protein, partial [Nannocystis exedens]|nr:acyl-CoA dehydrogenase family protein [Nannocystis exedens]
GGAHPRSILTTLSPDPECGGWRLDGEKRWSTLGGFAEELLVVARLPAPAGTERSRLCVIRMPASRPGVQLREMPATAFIPEVPHAAATFESVHVAAKECLAGDGYERYLKPFRTVEDCFVHSAMLAWLIRVGRHGGWPNEHVEGLAAALAGFWALSFADPSSAAVHRTLGGLLVQVHRLIDASEEFCSALDPETRHRWSRDRPLFSVAAHARARRLDAARRRTAAMDASFLA